MINILITDSGGTYDATKFVDTVTWSGEYTQCARTLKFNLVMEQTNSTVPCNVGDSVIFKSDGQLLFDGFIVSRQKNTGSNKIEIQCFDRGFYLNRNKGVYKFSGQTPENIVKRICADFGILTGEIAETGIPITRNFIGVSLYQIIMTAYTLAAEKTKASYMPMFKGDRFCIVEKRINSETMVIEGGANLMEASCTESIEKMVNQVVIYNQDDKIVKTLKNDEFIRLYGLMQEYIKQGDNDSESEKKAQKTLDDNGFSQKMTVEELGGVSNITGGTVVVREPYTGVYGLFYIDSDTHTWQNGLYFNKMVVNFKNIMDEMEVGSLPSTSNTKSSTKSTSGVDSGSSGGGWPGYINNPGEAT